MRQTHPRRSPTQAKPRRKRPGTPMLRLLSRTGGIDAAIVEALPRRSGEPYRERTIEWIGRSPSLETIIAACKRHGARVPNQFKETT